jgi:ketol-acid reductoisomerase
VALEGRSAATKQRAKEAGAEDVGTLEAVCRQAQYIMSIVPPHLAMALAQTVAEIGYKGESLILPASHLSSTV